MKKIELYIGIILNRKFLDVFVLEEIDKMEEKRTGRNWESQSKFNLEWNESFKNQRQLQSRLRILQIERQKKVKDIQKKLDKHKKNVQIKINKHDRKENLRTFNEMNKSNSALSFNRFQNQRKERQQLIRLNTDELHRSRNSDYLSRKKEKQNNYEKIRQDRELDLEQKTQKRNRVRLMQINGKENIISSWDRRLDQIKDGRRRMIQKKRKQHQQNMCLIQKMAKQQRQMLEKILQADQMEEEIDVTIKKEEQTDGKELTKLYTKKK